MVKRRHILGHSVLILGGLLAGLVAAEGLARIFLDPPPGYVLYDSARNEAHSALSNIVPDPKLGHRLAPHALGHDDRGFRNSGEVTVADVIAIGDSQTWGVNVGREDAWPSVLERVAGIHVYSMSLGGWGPLQYEVLAKDAVALRPRALILGIYLGNDIFDGCNQVYGTDAFPQYRQRGADFSADLSVLNARLKSTNDSTRVEQAQARFQELQGPAKLWRRLGDHSLIVQILMTRGWLPDIPSADTLYEEADKAWAREHPAVASVYRRGRISTVMTYGYRGTAVDLSNACIRDGVRITRDVLTRLKQLSDEASLKIGVLLIPTKESVYSLADETVRPQMTQAYREMVANEAAIKENLLAHCGRLKLSCVDLVHRLVKAVHDEELLYKADSDGHPVANGYRHIALAGQELLQALGVVADPDGAVAEAASARYSALRSR
jgi:hypothetical protein